MSERSTSVELGTAVISPQDDVVAGQVGTWRLTFTAGNDGLATGGGFRIYTDTDSDWGTPQFVNPAATEYMTVESPDGVQPAVVTMGVKSLRVTIHGRALNPGESITLIYGDTSGGGPGSRAQTFFEDRRYFWIDVDPKGNGDWQTLQESPCLRIIGDTAVQLVARAVPSTIAVEEPFRVVIKAEDRWGNPASGYSGTVTLAGDGLKLPGETIAFSPEDNGVKWIDGCLPERVGVLRLNVRDNANDLQGDSNPIIATTRRSVHQLFWADPHGGQLVSRDKFSDFFRYARDISGVQFVGFQRNADVISDDDWRVQQEQEQAFTEDGRFIPIPGFEWSGRTWEGGHHNVYFRRHGQPAKRNLPVEEMFQAERASAELAHIRDVYATYRNTDTMLTPHVGGEHSDLSHHEPALEPAVEISSTHGSFEWMLFDSLRRGYRMGFLGGSDCYTGRPGDDRPGFQLRRYAKSGLTGIYAKDITLGSFFEAMRARRVYATTGARIVLSLDGDGHPMGSEYTTSEFPALCAAVAGTGPLDRVELFRGTKLAYSHELEGQPSSRRVRIIWNGSSRMTSYSGIVWDGSLQVTGATIRSAETVRFDSPRSHIVEQTADQLKWHVWGCGYPMGVILELDDVANPAEVAFHVSVGTRVITGPGYGKHGSEWPKRVSFAEAEGTSFKARMSDVLNGDGVAVPLGVLDKQIAILPVPEDRPWNTDFCVMDDEAQPGYNPYWLRVVQLDGEMAWSSPVFVDFAGGEVSKGY